MMSDDASATYRGYRKQALYVLWRLLTDADAEKRIYHPEGAEDLAVFNLDQNLIEAVQVKDYRSPLALSHFKPSSLEGFFARTQTRRNQHPTATSLIASFGPLGPEFGDAIAGEGKSRNSVVKKINEANPRISISEAKLMLDALRGCISHPVETDLHEGVLEALKGTIADGHPKSTFELLLFWVFDASEHRRSLTRVALLQQLNRIGDYLAALRDSSAEWMTSVRPLATEAIDKDAQVRLRYEYQQGVQARWQHILAGADCPRSRWLEEIHNKFQRHSIVIIRGASGQGKSSLGFRYLHDYVADGLRFEIKLVNGREHALRVANALRGHVHRLRLPAVVWLDLAPSDNGWSDLLNELADVGLKVLVAVREEDFRRAGIGSDQLNYGEVSLGAVALQEAEAIYSKLTADTRVASLDFADAWSRFGATGGGPLLEFTHLITQGATLSAKLQNQVQRLKNEANIGQTPITPKHLRALALAALAHSAGCRIDGSRLCTTVALDPLAGPFTYLENEYLLRVSASGIVMGLHALRSKALLDALLCDAPNAWRELAVECLPLLLDEDIESFLLSAFSRRPEYSDGLIMALQSLPLRSWTQAGGIGRALLWEGLSRYEQENREALAAAIKKFEGQWYLLCDSQVGGGLGALENLRKLLAEMRREELPYFELTPKSRVFGPLGSWVEKAAVPILPPTGVADWLGIADLAFWLGSQALHQGLIYSTLKGLLPQELPDNLKLVEISQLVSAFHALDYEAFSKWHDHQAPHLIRWFLRETGSVHLVDDGQEVKVFFPVFTTGGDESSGDWENAALRLLRLLHDLFPQRSKLCSQGVGVELLNELVPFDLTQKNVDSSKFVSIRIARLNATFANLVSYRHRRLSAWREYAETAFALRETVCTAFRELHRGWGRMLAQPIVRSRTIKELPGALLGRVQSLAQQPMLPRIAVDEWGFESEDRDPINESKDSRTPKLGGMHRFQRWRKAFGDFTSAVNSAVQPIIDETAVFVVLRNKDPDKPADCDGGRLLLNNLGDAWQALSSVQREFGNLFGSIVDTEKLAELDRHEQSTFKHLWAVAFTIVRKPRSIVLNAAVDGVRNLMQRRDRFLTLLEKEIHRAFSSEGLQGVQLHECRINEERRLAIACDHASMDTLSEGNARIVSALWNAAHSEEWSAFEWMPLVVEWPKLFVVHLLRGRALIPAGVQHTLMTLFLRSKDEAPAPHQLIALPVSRATFIEAGIPVNDSPVLNAVVIWQGSLLAFTFTVMRFSSCIKLAIEYQLSDASLTAPLERFSRETSEVLNVARASYESLCSLLTPIALTPVADSEQTAKWIERVTTISENCLFSLKPDATIDLNIETFQPWIEEVKTRADAINAIVSEMIEVFG